MKPWRTLGIALALLVGQATLYFGTLGLLLWTGLWYPTEGLSWDNRRELLFQLFGQLPLAAVLGVSGVLPVLLLRWLLPPESRGPKSTVLVMVTAWAVATTVLRTIYAPGWVGWERFAAYRLTFQDECLWRLAREDPAGLALLAVFFLAWPVAWGIHLRQRMAGSEILARWGRRVVRLTPLWVGLLALLAGILHGLLVWQGRRDARVYYQSCIHLGEAGLWELNPGLHPSHWDLDRILTAWSKCSWSGYRSWSGWVPRWTWWETLKLLTGQDLPNDPEAWRAWLEAHPDLVWDPKQCRFVEPSSSPEMKAAP